MNNSDLLTSTPLLRDTILNEGAATAASDATARRKQVMDELYWRQHPQFIQPDFSNPVINTINRLPKGAARFVGITEKTVADTFVNAGIDPYGVISNASKQIQRELIDANPHSSSGDIFSQKSLGDFGLFLAENLGDSVAYMVPALLAGRVAGTLVGAGSRALGFTADVTAKAANVATTAGLYGTNLSTQYEQTKDLTADSGIENPNKAAVLAAAGAKAALDSIGMSQMANALGLGKFFAAHVVEEASKRGLKQILRNEGLKAAVREAAKTGGKVAGVEGITEALQEVIDVGMVAAMKDQSLWAAYPEHMRQIANAGVLGAIMGGVVHAGGAALGLDGAQEHNSITGVTEENIGSSPAATPEAVINVIETAAQINATRRREKAAESTDPVETATTPPTVTLPVEPAPVEQNAAASTTTETSATAETNATTISTQPDADLQNTHALATSYFGETGTQTRNGIELTYTPGETNLKLVAADGEMWSVPMTQSSGSTLQMDVSGTKSAKAQLALASVLGSLEGDFKVLVQDSTGTNDTTRTNVAPSNAALRARNVMRVKQGDKVFLVARPKVGALVHGQPVNEAGNVLLAGTEVDAGTYAADPSIGTGQSTILNTDNNLSPTGDARAGLTIATPADFTGQAGRTLIDVVKKMFPQKMVEAVVRAAHAHVTGKAQRKLTMITHGSISHYGALPEILHARLSELQKTFPEVSNVVAVLTDSETLASNGLLLQLNVTSDANASTAIIVVNVNKLAGLSQDGGRAVDLRAFDNTITHEFGHAIIRTAWGQLSSDVKARVLTLFEQQRTAGAELTFRQVAERFYDVNTPSNLSKIGSGADSLTIAEGMGDAANYFLGDEEQFVRIFADILSSTNLRPTHPLAKPLTSVANTIKRFAVIRGYGSVKAPAEMREVLREILTTPRVQSAVEESPNGFMEDREIAAVGAVGAMAPTSVTNGKEYMEMNSPARASYALSIGASANQVSAIQRQGSLNLKGFAFLKKILNFPQLVDRFNVPELANYWDVVKRQKTLKNNILATGSEVMTSYNRLSRSERRLVGEFMFFLNDFSEQQGRRMTPVEIVQLATGTYPGNPFGRKMSDKAAKVAVEVDNSFAAVLERMQTAQMVEAAGRVLPLNAVESFVEQWSTATTVAARDAIETNFAGSTFAASGLPQLVDLKARLTNIMQSTASLRARNYMTKMRHGDYFVRVKATTDVTIAGQAYAAGDTIYFAAFDSEKARNTEINTLRNSLASYAVSIKGDKLADMQKAVAGLPRTFIDTMLTNSQLHLSPDQVAELHAMALEYTPSKSFIRNFLRRNDIQGYDTAQFERSYNAYMFRAAGNISRTHFVVENTAAINAFELAKDKLLAVTAVDNTAWTVLQDFVRSHHADVNSADTDLSTLRSLASAWYLGYNPKSAIANLWQVPMATYPYLSAKYGDIATGKAVAAAYTKTLKALKNGKLDPALSAALSKAIADGQLDASAVVELSAMGDSNLFDKMTGLDTQRFFAKYVIHNGFYMFRKAEALNRRVTFVAAFDLAYADTQNADAAYVAATKALELTQFDMSKEARAEVFKGKTGFLLMFNQHVTMMSYLAFGGFSLNSAKWKVGVRVLMMAMLVTGIEGVPLLGGLGIDIFDVLKSTYLKLTGEEYTYSDARRDLREVLAEADQNPDLWMHGFARENGVPFLTLASLLGAPDFNVDLTGSLQMGYPGSWAEVARNNELDAKNKLLGIIKAFGGAGAGIAFDIYSSFADDSLDEAKKRERRMPIFMRNLATAYRWKEDGGVVNAQGANVYPIQQDNMADAAFKSLGFTPTKLSRFYEKYGMDSEAAAYWATKKQGVTELAKRAIESKDPEAIAAAKEAIARHNNLVKDMDVGKAFAIKMSRVRSALKAEMKDRKRVEAGYARRKNQQALFQQTNNLFGESTAPNAAKMVTGKVSLF